MSTAPQHMKEAGDSKPIPDSVVILRNSNGDTIPGLFELTRLGSDRVTLRALSSGRYLSTQAEGLGKALSDCGEQIGQTETFTMTEDAEGTVTFRLPGGSGFLSASQGEEPLLTSAPIAGATERFSLLKLDLDNLPKGGHGGCCSAWTATSETGALWDDVTHETIFRNAVRCLRDVKSDWPEEFRKVQQFLQTWDTFPEDFAARVENGLKDADYKYPWQGNMITWNGVVYHTYHDHFYNPGGGYNSGRNYRGDVNHDRSNAATEGRRYFNLSVYHGMRVNAYEAKNPGKKAPKDWYLESAYYLGLCLHFLTDLTQPMHAANFANAYGENGGYPGIKSDKRHSLFEGYVENRVKKGDFDKYLPARKSDIDTRDVENAFWFLHHTAVNAKQVFEDHLRKPLAEMKDWTDESQLPKAKIDETLELTLRIAHRAVARFLMYWSGCIRQTWDHIDQKWFYRIEEPTKNEWICLESGKYKRQKWQDGHDLMFFLFNADGTWSIGCQRWPGNLMTSPFGEYTGPDKQPPPAARFRIVPNGKLGGNDETVWIFENIKHPEAKEVMAINNVGDLVTWEPENPGTQLFKLKKMRAMSRKEEEDIEKRWPDFKGRPAWYGRP